MKQNFLFDIDGTLTPPRQRIREEFEEYFFNWMNDKKVFLVTGSDYSKIKEQLSERIIDKCEGIFCSMGNELYIGTNLIYSNKLEIEERLLSYLSQQITASKFIPKNTKNFEFRTGMLNFSIIGRDCTQDQRERYYEWDKVEGEREKIAAHINENYLNIEACVGGQISIDIQNKGNNKSLASKRIRKEGRGHIYFFGDKTNVGGNDWDICNDIDLNKDGKWFNVENIDELKKILENF